MKKLTVNENCIGCGACASIDEEHFDINDNGLSEVISNENLESENLKIAMNACPVNAIHFTEEGSCNCGDTCTCGDDCSCGNDCPCHKQN